MQALDSAFWDGSCTMLIEAVRDFNLFCGSDFTVGLRWCPQAKVVDVVANVLRETTSTQAR